MRYVCGILLAGLLLSGCTKIIEVKLPMEHLLEAQRLIQQDTKFTGEEKERMIRFLWTENRAHAKDIIDRTDRQAERGLSTAEKIVQWVMAGVGIGVAAAR